MSKFTEDRIAVLAKLRDLEAQGMAGLPAVVATMQNNKTLCAVLLAAGAVLGQVLRHLL